MGTVPILIGGVVLVNVLSEAQYEFLLQYIQLLETVEEGIVLVDQSYQERNFGSGDKLLADIIGAFVPFNASNKTIRTIFSFDSGILAELDKFESLLEQVLHLNTLYYDQEAKVVFINEFLLPAYKQWKKDIQLKLNEYVLN